MSSMFKPLTSRLTSQQVVDSILDLLRSGQLSVGNRLPAESELALRLNVGRSSIREAIKTLETLGIVEIRRGRGTYVVMSPGTVDSPVPWLLAHSDDVLELLEARQALEMKTAALAAANWHTAEEMASLDRINLDMEEALHLGEHKSLDIIDLSFHNRIAELSRNTYLLQMSRFVNHVYSDRQAVLSIPGRAEQSLRDHRQITDAIQQRNAEDAARGMMAHLEKVKEAVAGITGQRLPGA